MPGWLGPWEIVIFVVVVVLLFGTKRLPEVGRSMGRSLRELKDAVSIKDDAKGIVAELNPMRSEASKEDERPRGKIDRLLGVTASESEERADSSERT